MTTYDTAAVAQKVNALYLENLNRPGEPEGIAYYTTLVTNGVTLDAVDHMMESSPEYVTLHGGTTAGVTAAAAGNGRAWLLAGVLGLVVFIVIRRAKK